nr:reverse transcriptase [Tanacetum cinerariifolium]
MPALEDVSIFNFLSDDENNGTVADMNNLDTTIQVSPIPTTRIHKDHHLDQVIGDLQLATKQERCQRIWRNMGLLVLFNNKQTINTFKTFCLLDFYHRKNPKGFKDPDFLDRVYKVEKALYGLHQAPRASYDTLSTYLLDNGFQRGKIDKTFFIKRHKDHQLDGVPTHKRTFSAPSYTKKIFGLAMPTDPHHTPTILQPSSYQPQKTQKPWKPKRKDTQVPQPSGPTKSVVDEAVHKELGDSLEIFAELGRMGYEKPPSKLTFHKAFFSVQWRFLIHTLIQCVSAKRTAWNEFSCSMASAVICLAIVIINNQVDDLTSHITKYTSLALTQKVFANMRKVGKVAELEKDKHTQALEIIKLKKMLKKLEKKKKKSKSSGGSIQTGGKIEAIDADVDSTLVDVDNQVDMDAELQGRIDQDVSAATMDVCAAKPTVFDYEKEVSKSQEETVSIAQARKNMIIYMKNMVGYRMEHFKGMTCDKVKYPLINWKIHSEGSRTYWKIIRVGRITKAYQSFEDMLKGFDREDLVALWILVKEKFSSAVPREDKKKALWVELKRLFEPNAADVFWKIQDAVMILMLSAKLQVDKDCEMARDLVMKIFMEANKPKSKIGLDLSKLAIILNRLKKINSKGLTDYKKLYFFEYEHVVMNLTCSGLDAAAIGKPVCLVLSPSQSALFLIITFTPFFIPKDYYTIYWNIPGKSLGSGWIMGMNTYT